MSSRSTPSPDVGRYIRRKVGWEGVRRGAVLFLSLGLAVIMTGLLPAITKTDAAFAETNTQPSGGASNPFFVYVQSGEYVYADSAELGDVVDQDENVVSSAGANLYGPATADGIWQVDIGAVNDADTMVDWEVIAQSSNGTEIPGRVWSELYGTYQPQGADGTFDYWVVNDSGYVYEVSFAGYNGIQSRFRADSVGNPIDKAEGCEPSYLSKETDGADNGWDAIPDCGGEYRIFFSPPSDDLPAEAKLGETTVPIQPDVLDADALQVEDLVFNADAPGAATGEFSWSIDSRFTGSYWLEIDVDGDGEYDGEADVRIPQYADGSSAYGEAFNGLDGNGDPIENCTSLNARLHFDRIGEVHFVQDDVEGKESGVRITRLNGQNSPDSTIYWDDTQLALNRTNTTPVLDGTAGVDSSSGVHGWNYDLNSWGNARVIDDWAFMPIEQSSEEITFGGQCLEIEKTSDATEDTRVGDTVDYTVTATNTGDADFTEDDPAHMFDDLSGVLDDADYNSDGAANQAGDVSYDEPILSWSGELPAGASVELTYSVTLTTGGDGKVKNIAWEPGDPEDPKTPKCEPLAPQRPDSSTGEVCDTTEFELPRLQISKEADKTELPKVGETLTYTVTVENVGPGDYTADQPATMTDDLSDVLDDATISDADLEATVGEASIDGDTLSWEGVLTAGEAATITYTVTYTGEGNQQLDNVACIPENETAPGSESCDTVEVPGSGLVVSKESNPSSEPLETGSHVDYTLWFTNEGQAAADVDHTDYIGYVTDDATIIDGPAAGEGDLTATLTDDNIRIVGSVPAGDSYSITYRVEIKPEADRGDNLLVNHLLEGDPEEPPTPPEPGEECVDTTTTTCNPVGLIEYEKTVSGDEPFSAGSVLTYELEIKNTGEAQANVNREDVLTDVLDDARLTADPESDTDSVTVSEVEDERFTIGGTLNADETATVTYEVTLKADEDRGNNQADNFLVTPGEDPPAECEEGDLECTSTVLPLIEPQKTVDPESGSTVLEGDVLSYTLTFKNSGDATGAIDYTDPLEGVLDDADLTGDPASSLDSVEVTVSATEPDNDTLRVEGEVPAGETATVTYEVTVKPDGERGDNTLDNFLFPTDEEPPTDCDADSGLCTENPVPHIVSGKTSDPAVGTRVVAGAELTYTLTFTNEGKAAGEVTKVDDLSHVLDDADLVGEPEASESALSVDRDGDVMTITGELEPGQSETVTYTVKVRDADERGDDILANYLLDPGTEPPSEPVCEPGEGEAPDCTRHPVGEISATKTVDPETGTHVADGQELTYTLSFTNTGEGRADVDYVDHLGDVLDDATLTEEPGASEGLVVTGPDDDALVITGAVKPGETGIVTYTVTVKEYDEQGNHNLGNFLTLSDQEPPAECVDKNPMCTGNPTDPPSSNLPQTGTQLWFGVGLAALLLVGAGRVLVASRK